MANLGPTIIFNGCRIEGLTQLLRKCDRIITACLQLLGVYYHYKACVCKNMSMFVHVSVCVCMRSSVCLCVSADIYILHNGLYSML